MTASTRRRAAAALLALASGVFFLVGSAAPASAHAAVIAETPGDGQSVARAPATVSATFSEAVSADVGGMSVRNSTGARVDDGQSKSSGATVSVGLRPDLPDGTYVVTFRVLSADGHPVSGSWLFGIGAAPIDRSISSQAGTSGDSTWEAIATLARFIMYVAALLTAGVAFFCAFVHDQMEDRDRLLPIVRLGALATIIGAVGIVIAQSALLSGRGLDAATDGTVLSSVLSGWLGWSLALLLVGLVGAHLSTDFTAPKVARPLALYGGLAVTISFALWGHTTELRPVWISMSADVVHATAAALWFGGLVGLLVVLIGRRAEFVATTATIVRRFSTMATWSVLALALAGLTLTLTGTDASWNALVTTTWGRLVLVKFALTALVVALAAYNRQRLVPEVSSASDAQPMAWRRLRRTMATELVLVLVVFGVTSRLVFVTPARTAAALASATTTRTVDTSDGTARLTVDPSRVGTNSVRVQFLDASGQPADLANSATFEYSLPAAELGPITREVVKTGPGLFATTGRELSIAGDWIVVVTVRTGDFTEQRVEFTIPIRP